MNKLIYCLKFIFLFTLLSCNPLDKTILEDLSIEDIKKATEKDTSFYATYEVVRKFKELNKDKISLAKYSNLTWEDINDYFTSIDTISWDYASKKFEKEYSNTFNENLKKGIEYVEEWEAKKIEIEKKNDLDKYIKIDLIRIKTDYYTYTGGVEDVWFTFKLTPLLGKIQQLTWRINPTPKIKGKSFTDDTFNLLDSQGYIYSRPFTKAINGRYSASYSHREMAEGRSVKSFLRDYNLNLKISKVRVNGENIEFQKIDLPYEVKYYIKYKKEKNIGMQNIYLESIVKEYIDESFVSKYDFISSKVDSIKKEKFPLEYSFLKKYNNLLVEHQGLK